MLAQHHQNAHTHTHDARPRFIYLPNHQTTKQKLICMRHVQWVEYDAHKNALRMKIVNQEEVEEYAPDPKFEDPTIAKRMFYNMLRDARSEGKVIEW
jgi:hypothetical protein